MKLINTLFLLIFSLQISAQDSLIFLQMDLNFEVFKIEQHILFDSFSDNTKNSALRYQVKEIKPTPLLTKRIVSIKDVYYLNFGFEKPFNPKSLLQLDDYTLAVNSKNIKTTKWNFSTNSGYHRSQNIFLRINENSAIVGHNYPLGEYFRSGFETHFSKSDIKVHLNYSYSNEIYYDDSTRPLANYGPEFGFDFPRNYVEQRFLEWIPIRFALLNNRLTNIARMNFNLVVNPIQQFLLKADLNSNFVFSGEDSREHFRTLTFGIGIQPTDKTLLFINRSQTTLISNISRNFRFNSEPIMTLNIRHRLTKRVFP